MIIDAFTFFNELDILEARLKYLDNIVDYFLIVESNVTFSGKSKSLILQENIDRFSKYKKKIILAPFIFDNSQYNFNFNLQLSTTDYNSPHWKIERLQRNHISTALDRFSDSDFILIGDVDEIPKKDAIRFAKNNPLPGIECAAFLQHMFYYNCGNLKTDPWKGTVFTTIKKVKEKSPQWFRDNKEYNHLVPHVQNAGWHLSYFGGVDNIIGKIESFSHQELNTDHYKNKDRIQQAIDQGKDLYDRPWDVFVKSNISLFDTEFIESFYKYIPALDFENELEKVSSAWHGHKKFANWLVEEFNPTTVVDLGVDTGISTFSFSKNKNTMVYGIDCFDFHFGNEIRDTYDFVLSFQKKYNLDNIKFIKGYFNDVALTWDKKIDILHIDGLHDYNSVKNDYETWKHFLSDDSIILFHDTVSYPDDVGRFFNELNLPKVNFLHSAGLGVASKNRKIIDKISKKYKLSIIPEIKVFLHLLDFEQGQHISNEIIDNIISSDLINNCELHISLNYNSDFGWLKNKLINYKNVKYITTNGLPDEYEIPTLKYLKDYCDNSQQDFLVLYLHHKGISKPYDKKINDWRKLMLHFTVNQWKETIKVFDQAYDTAGVNWNKDYIHPHYGGNFWWATSSYIKNLPKFDLPRNKNYQTQFHFSSEYHKQDAEFWLGINNPNAYSLHNSNVNHYNSRYLEYNYKNINLKKDYYKNINRELNSDDFLLIKLLADYANTNTISVFLNSKTGVSASCFLEMIINKKVNNSTLIFSDKDSLNTVINNMTPFDSLIEIDILTEFSHNHINDKSIDFLFLENLEQGKFEYYLHKWINKIKPNGYIIGNNFFLPYISETVLKTFGDVDLVSSYWYKKI
jgi:predicted O-methyltransferase YrrM